jgi:hypothetical protein
MEACVKSEHSGSNHVGKRTSRKANIQESEHQGKQICMAGLAQPYFISPARDFVLHTLPYRASAFALYVLLRYACRPPCLYRLSFDKDAYPDASLRLCADSSGTYKVRIRVNHQRKFFEYPLTEAEYCRYFQCKGEAIAAWQRNSETVVAEKQEEKQGGKCIKE